MKKLLVMRYIGIILFTTILDIFFHAIFKVQDDKEYSVIVKTIGQTATATLYLLFAISVIALVFYKVEDKIQGKRFEKGIRFGVAMGLVWLWGMIEAVPWLGHSFAYEFIMGVADTLPIVLMGILLSFFTTENNAKKINSESINISKLSTTLIIFSTIFLIGRYIFYLMGIMESGYEIRPIATFVWTLLMGSCIGIVYLLLFSTFEKLPIFIKSIKFGAIIFGVNWMVFNIFIPIYFNENFGVSIIRVISDILLVILSCYLLESLDKKYYKKNL